MMQLVIEIPDNATAARIAEAVCTTYGYTGPATAADRIAFVKQKIRDHLKEITRSHEVLAAAKAASKTAADNADTITLS